MAGLPDALHARARTSSARSALRAHTGVEWRHLAWGELEGLVGRVAAGLATSAPRGATVGWRAPEGLPTRVVDLALLHLGAVGAWGGHDLDVDDAAWERLAATRADPARLALLRAELREGDPAAVRDGKLYDHAGVVALAERLAATLGAGPGEEVLVTAGGLEEQAAAWASVAGGFGLVLGDAELLPVVEPVGWVCTPVELEAAAPPPSRVGRFAAPLRRWGRAGAVLGNRLRCVLVAGEPPPEARALRERGIEVRAMEPG